MGWMEWDGIIEKADYLYMLRSMRDVYFLSPLYFLHLPAPMMMTRVSQVLDTSLGVRRSYSVEYGTPSAPHYIPPPLCWRD